MKHLQIFLFISLVQASFAQSVRTLEPKIGDTFDFTPDYISKFNSPESFDKCQKVWDKMNKDGRSFSQATATEKEILKYCDEIRENVWDILGGGCSWYCGMGPTSLISSSTLASQGKVDYKSKNAHDFSYQTAWVEGVPGHGIGEYLEYTFVPENPRINTIIVVNGYVKSKSSYESNSRAKQLKMYLNDELFAYLNLKDVMAEQRFSIPPIGNSDRANWDKLKSKSEWKVKFEISEVYKGTKYEDLAITEIYFDGLDVHCFGKGTKVRMADNSVKNIEELKIGDFVMSYNLEHKLFEHSQILELANPIHDQLIKIKFNDGSQLIATADHPFYDGNNWRSFSPTKTKLDYNFNHVLQLKSGDVLKTIDSEIEILDIGELDNAQETFTIVKLERNSSFIVNNIIVGTEELRLPTIVAVARLSVNGRC